MCRLSIFLGLAILLASADCADAQAQIPTPPHRFYGSVRLNGVPPPDGTPVVAVIGAVDCGRAEIVGGAYRLDAIAATQRAGCGVEGQMVRFRVGGASATQVVAWRGAAFTELALVAQAAAFTTAALDLGSPCIPEKGALGCDAARLRLWRGDRDAWSLLFRALGSPEPDGDRVFGEVLRMRLEAGDPALVAEMARRLGWPHLRVSAVRFRGAAQGEADEYVEIRNLGGAGQLMDGWRLRAAGSGAEFRFLAGWMLPADGRCRVYTNQTHHDSCPGLGFGATYGLWDDTADTALLTVDYPSITADRARYSAEPAAQLPPPALRGVDAGQ
jgi:hypothetical protein